MSILNIILVVLAILSLIFGQWIGAFLSKILLPVVHNPYGAVVITIALVIIVINFSRWLISLGKISKKG